MQYVIGRNNIALAYNGKLMGIQSSMDPPYSLRFEFSNPDYSPLTAGMNWKRGSRWERVQGAETNQWYWIYENPDWSTSFANLLPTSTSTGSVRVLSGNTPSITSMESMFFFCTALVSVELFDTHNVTAMNGLFYNCRNLTSVPLFDTSNVTTMASMFDMCFSLSNVGLFDTHNVTRMDYMFARCSSLRSIPLFDTSSVTNMTWMFNGCANVESGAYALYQQASSKTDQPVHDYTFRDCGINTTTGAAELAQIPESWK